ncbi:MAG: hypothetical protein KTR31_12540 [Myxococcales bacterium]|nr:hypothetical protein [Myxococcales bacterium]
MLFPRGSRLCVQVGLALWIGGCTSAEESTPGGVLEVLTGPAGVVLYEETDSVGPGFSLFEAAVLEGPDVPAPIRSVEVLAGWTFCAYAGESWELGQAEGQLCVGASVDTSANVLQEFVEPRVVEAYHDGTTVASVKQRSLVVDFTPLAVGIAEWSGGVVSVELQPGWSVSLWEQSGYQGAHRCLSWLDGTAQMVPKSWVDGTRSVGVHHGPLCGPIEGGTQPTEPEPALAPGDVALAVPDPVGPIGKDDGDAYTLACGENQALIGIEGRSGGKVYRLQPVCADLVIEEDPTGAYAMVPEGSALGDWAGGGGGDPFVSSCPDGEVVVGVHGGVDDELKQLGLTCAAMPLVDAGDGWAVEAAGAHDLEGFGGSRGDAFSLRCAERAVAVGFDVQSRGHVYQVEVLCSEVDVVL